MSNTEKSQEVTDTGLKKKKEGKYFCKKHTKKLLSAWSQTTKEFLCSDCIYEMDLNDTWVPSKQISEQVIFDHVDYLSSILQNLKTVIGERLDELKKMRNKEESFHQTDIQEAFQKCSQILTEATTSDRDILSKIKTYNSDPSQHSNGEKPKMSIFENKEPQILRLMDSQIIYSDSMRLKVGQLINRDCMFTTLYRGSRDGFFPEDFQQKCDNKGPTLTIVKTSDKKVFGGYTPISWESSGGFIVDEGKSFLFSVRDDKSVTKLDYNTGYEVYHDDDRLMNFYYGFSIHSKIEGFCCIDDNYKKPMQLDPNSDKAQYYLTHGKKEFSVVELEVFLVEY